MDAKKELGEFKNKFDKKLTIYLDQKLNEAKKLSPKAATLVDHIANLTLRGGKRIRPAILYYSYLAHGGKNLTQAMQAAMAMELAETYLLIHDDIMDDDSLRRGGPTIHASYEKIAKTKYHLKTGSHNFGISMAILAGDIASAMSSEVIAESNFKDRDKVQALEELSKIYINECYGQGLDIYGEVENNLTKDDIILIHQLKTVPYTFDGPIKMGAMLAGANDKKIKKLEKYSYPVGTAFQIRDDILGLFGTQEKIGKPITSDLEEGKKTLLILVALEKANAKQKEIILKNLGNKKITDTDLYEVRKIVENTDSLDYSVKLADKLVSEAIQSIKKLDLKSPGKDFLIGIAEYIVKREY